MKSGALVRVVWAVGFLFPVAIAATPGEATACGTAVYREIDNNSALVAKAEQALGQGRFAEAAVKAVQAFPALKIVKPGTLPLADRALRILALASTRADGNITAGTMKSGTAADRTANLEWSIDTLRTLSAKRANNPSYQTDLGEALAHVPAHHEEALKVLGELADKDLLTSAEGYAALGRLRAEKGDANARLAAVKRCEAMTKTPKICDAPAAADGAGRS
ncbi:Hypothetical protein A7982_05359 [Minicystis rosea]|nr:Hypothetical protein A7982_05359 [Minicystis rosea]